MDQIIIVRLISDGFDHYIAPATSLDEAFTIVFNGMSNGADNFSARTYVYDSFLHFWIVDHDLTFSNNKILISRASDAGLFIPAL